MTNERKKNNNNNNIFLSVWIWFFLLNNVIIKVIEINNIDILIAKLPNRIDMGNSKNKYNNKYGINKMNKDKKIFYLKI